MKNGEVRARVVALRAPVIANVQYGLEQATNDAQEAFAVSKARDTAPRRLPQSCCAPG